MIQHEFELAIANVLSDIAGNLHRQVRRHAGSDDACTLSVQTLRPPHVIDWDEYELRRNVSVVEQPPIRRNRIGRCTPSTI